MPDRQNTPVEIWLRAGDTKAGFLPSVGFNCTALRVQNDSRWVSALAEPPTWGAARECPSFFGCPILGPYAYDVRDDTLRYRGKSYRLKPGGEAKAMHGVTRDHAWKIIDHHQGDDEAVLVAHLEIGGENHAAAARLDEFPFPMDIQVTYTLRSRCLAIAFLVRNTGCPTLPFGIGIHPYLTNPLAAGLPAQEVTMAGPLARIVDGPWGRANARLGGHESSANTFAVRLDQYLSRTRQGRPFLDLFERTDGPPEPAHPCATLWSLCDPAAGLVTSIQASADFRYVGLFSPDHRRVLSPVISTNRPGAFELAERGCKGGLLELAPGDVWQGSCSLHVGKDNAAPHRGA